MNVSKQLLLPLGLSEFQAKVYIAALELGEASMQQLSQKSGVKRTTIYHFIDELRERGFISETRKRKRLVYSAVDPEYILELEKGRLVELHQLLPDLQAIHNKSHRKPRVTFYEGLQGIKEVYADTLKEKQPIIAYSDFEHMKQVLGDFFDQYPPERARKNITFQSIVRDSPIARENSKRDYGLLRDTKFLSSGDLKTEINIYGDKVALMSFRSNPPFVVLIEDHDIAETLRTGWHALWSKLPDK